MDHLIKYENFLNESAFDKDWPHWVRFGEDRKEDAAVIQYGIMNVGNINTEKNFLGRLNKMGIRFKYVNPGHIEIKHEHVEKLKSAMRPQSNI
jgi:hypothetical protein